MLNSKGAKAERGEEAKYGVPSDIHSEGKPQAARKLKAEMGRGFLEKSWGGVRARNDYAARNRHKPCETAAFKWVHI